MPIRIRRFSSPYSTPMWEITDQKNSECGPFSRSEVILLKFPRKPKITTQTILHKHLTKKGGNLKSQPSQ